MLYLYYGPNTFLIEEKIKGVKDGWLKKFGQDFSFFKIDLAEEGAEGLKSALSLQSMFEPKRLVFLRGALLVSAGDWAELETILNTNKANIKSSDLVLVFYDFLVNANEGIKKRITTLAGLGSAEEFKNPERAGLVSFALKKAGELNLKMGAGEASFLVDGFFLGDMARINNELIKLKMILGDAPVKTEVISDLVSFQNIADNFVFAEALAQRKINTALKNLHLLIEKGEDPIAILGALVWQFRLILRTKEIGSAEGAAQKLKLSPWSTKKAFVAGKNFTTQELKNAYQKLADADLAVKTGAADGREVLEDFVYSFLKS